MGPTRPGGHPPQIRQSKLVFEQKVLMSNLGRDRLSTHRIRRHKHSGRTLAVQSSHLHSIFEMLSISWQIVRLSFTTAAWQYLLRRAKNAHYVGGTGRRSSSSIS